MKTNSQKKFHLLLLSLLITTFALPCVYGNDIPSPETYFGFRMGEAKKLVNYDQLVEYFKLLANESDCITVSDLGTTTDGNPFVLVIISAKNNLKKAQNIKNIQTKLADARITSAAETERLVNSGKAIVSVNCSIHSTEIGASQMAAEFAYQLITKNHPNAEEILENVVVLLLPAHNPDGLNMVVDWYRKYVGTEYEGCRLPWLYHRYTGHDNNRDWFMLTQKETQLTVSEIYNVWRPHVVLDMHQMGRTGPRLFLPPYIDPIDPNVDPILQSEMSMLGTFIQSDLCAQGFRGVITQEIFDAYTPARAYPNYHGGIRFLTEAASCRIATPVIIKPEELSMQGDAEFLQTARWNFPLPWFGGEWTLRDIVEYDKAAVWALLTHAARHRDMWLRNAYTIAQHAIEKKNAPFGFLIPEDQHDSNAAKQMANILQGGLVELYHPVESFEYRGKRYSEHTIIIPLAQPHGAYARTLLEQTFYTPPRVHPDAPPSRPYDATTHNLPLLMGVFVEKIEEPVDIELKIMKTPVENNGVIEGDGKNRSYILERETNSAFVISNNHLESNGTILCTTDYFNIDGKEFSPGTFILENVNKNSNLEKLCEETGIRLIGAPDNFDVPTVQIKKPKIALYQSWTAPMDEGWTRWVLEQGEFEYSTVHDEDIRNVAFLDSYDVLILPSQSAKSILDGLNEKDVPKQYSGGIGEQGLTNLKAFVNQGGLLIAFDRACELPISHFYLPIKNVTAGVDRDTFFCPGALLRLLLNPEHPIAYGMPRTAAAFFYYSAAFDTTPENTIAYFSHNNLLMGGWIHGSELISGRTSVADVSFGGGRIILFGFRPQFRAQTVGTFKLLYNALYYASFLQN